jgi:GDP/UDP-N,N'-diacetylbacillosamine 2-epimerase (hydrolysing)
LGFLKYGSVLVGNSSSGMIEASYFRIPVVNIGIRQNGRQRGQNVLDVGHCSREIHKIIEKCLEKNTPGRKNENIFGVGQSSKKIVKYLEKTGLTNDILKKEIEY